MRRAFGVVCAVTGLLLALASCRTMPAQWEEPAVIINPTPESRAALVKAVSEALNGAPVTLAENALTTTNTLTIERVHPLDPSGLPMNGRERGLPERFELVKTGEDCLLVQLSSGRRFTLAGMTCSAM